MAGGTVGGLNQIIIRLYNICLYNKNDIRERGVICMTS